MPSPISQSYPVAGASVPSLLTWLKESLGHPEAELHTKLRGNILHVLCETPEALDQATVLLRLVRSLLEDRQRGWLKQAYPQVYQVYLYSRLTGQPKPDWTAPIYLNRLERHLAQLVLEHQNEDDLKAARSLLADYAQDHPDLVSGGETGSGAMVLSTLSLARKGDPDAIAWYLSETLSALDVGVWVSIRAIPGTAHLHRSAIVLDHAPTTLAEPEPALGLGVESEEMTIPRLWILCEAAYSPDPSLIARPTAERLRLLQLTQFKDAVLLLQVRGESKPDWSLRIDLTPPEEMLREWGRWGDADALARLMTAAIASYHMATEVELVNGTLHLVCRPQLQDAYPQTTDTLEAQAEIIETLAMALDELAPQGIQRAVIYGQRRGQEEPTWVHYLDLPASSHEALADSPDYLGQTGDLPAIAFLLTRQLNPNLDDRLATGGLRVQLLLRDKLLHVMVDSPLPPQRRWVAPLVHRYLRDLSPVGVEGVRIYGRRSGQPQPAWSYGRDFVARDRLVPEAAPEFTASDAYVNELLVRPDGPITHAELAPAATPAALELWWQKTVAQGRSWLVRSHLFASQAVPGVVESTAAASPREGLKIALIWGAVGVLVALQVDWLLGQVLSPPTNSAKAEPMVTAPEPDPGKTANNDFEAALSELDWPTGPSASAGDGFVSQAEETAITGAPGDLTTSPDQPLVEIEALVAASPFPTFNSQQLNEKVALYRQRLETAGPADVMVVGSSRALRGVDPVALQKQLAALGHEDVSIFNFGINGATAQVVDLVIRQVLQPDELPKLIIWADGARAFNSGREDATYNAIVASPGYRELMAQRSVAPDGETAPGVVAAAPSTSPETGQTLPGSYAEMDQWMSDQVGSLSAVYGDRDRLKQWLQSRLAAVTSLPKGAEATEEKLDAPMPEGSVIDFDGFLPLSLRFNPATYYQTYARVSGRYDGDYDDFRLDGQQAEAFSNLLKFTQASNIPIVFINTPLTDEYLDDYRQDAEAEFLKYMVTLSTTETGFLFRDLGQLWPERYDYFSDPSHLNRYGAYQVSSWLAQDPLIAWPSVAPPPSP